MKTIMICCNKPPEDYNGR